MSLAVNTIAYTRGSVMNTLDNVRLALETLDRVVEHREAFIKSMQDEDGEITDYPKYDERMYDFALLIAERGEALALAISEYLKEKV
jgi:hypothetical protein